MAAIEPPPLIVIVGPTASGKSDLAMRLAKQIDGEIICADSRTVFNGMDIGTAKPSEADQLEVPHHLLDVVNPGERFTAADFQSFANEAIADIWRRGSIPIMVGGTGLYIDSVLFDYKFDIDFDIHLRDELNQKSVAELQDFINRHKIEMPINLNNKRHLVRAIERNGAEKQRSNSIRNNTLVIGIKINNDVLNAKIDKRAKEMFKNGVVKEATNLAKEYGWDNESMTASIYRILKLFVDGDINQDKAIDLFIKSDRQLARRQRTWFKRNPYIHWSDDTAELLSKALLFAKQYSSVG